MNLVEITELINSIPAEDQQFVDMYKKKRAELVEEINKYLAKVGQGPFSLRELLELSPRPELAETI